MRYHNKSGLAVVAASYARAPRASRYVTRYLFDCSSCAFANEPRNDSMSNDQAIDQLLRFERLAAGGWSADVEIAMDEDLIAPLARHRRFRPFLLHVLNDFSVRPTSADAARILRVLEGNVSRYFLRETGFHFCWWNREIRIRHAARLLQQPGRDVVSVAYDVGYADETTFARAFKECHGVGPQAFQRAARAILRDIDRLARARSSVARNAAEATENAGEMTKSADSPNGKRADAMRTHFADVPQRQPRIASRTTAAPMRR